MALTFFSVTDPFAKPGNNTRVNGINATGQIVGSYTDSFTTIDNPNPAVSLTVARGIDSSGNIVGISLDQTGEHAFVRLANGGFFRTDPPGATRIVEGAAINDTGQIVGRADTPATHGFV